jgi:hypothetical protein
MPAVVIPLPKPGVNSARRTPRSEQPDLIPLQRANYLVRRLRLVSTDLGLGRVFDEWTHPRPDGVSLEHCP